MVLKKLKVILQVLTMSQSYNIKFLYIRKGGEKADLYVFKEGTFGEDEVAYWLPHSQVEKIDENTISLPEWLITRNNLEEYIE